MANTERDVPNLSFRLPGLAPSVRPQNVFTPVAVGISKDTEELVRSLRNLRGELTEGFAPALKESREEQLRKGTQAAQSNQLKWADAVSSGAVDETANPWFIKGYLQQNGRVDAIRYEMEQQTDWAKSGVRNSDSADEFQKWQGGFRKRYAEANGGNQSPDYLAGFHAVADVADASMARQHIRTRQEEISNRVRENTGTEVSTILARHGGDAEKSSQEINLLGEKMKLDGLSPTDFRRIVADSVIATAKLTGNTSHLSVLDNVKLENGQPLSSDAAVRKARADLDYFLTQRSRSNTEWAWRLEDRQERLQDRERKKEVWARQDEEWRRNKDKWGREDFTRSAMALGVSAVFANPDDARNAAAPVMKELAGRDPEAARSFASWVESFYASSRTVDDREESSRLRWEMINAAGNPARQTQLLQEAFVMAAQGKINQSTVGNLVEDANKWRTSGADRLVQADEVRAVFAAVDRLAQKDVASGLTGQSAANALLGRRLLQNEATDFIAKNPQATSGQLADHLTKKLQSITPVINPNVQGTAGDDLRTQARQAQGRPDPTLDQAAGRISPTAVKTLIDAVGGAGTDAEAATILSQFDERAGQPGLGRRIIEREAAKTKTKPKR